MTRRLVPAVLVVFTLLVFAAPASAHVKWFTEFSFADEPATLDDILNMTFLGLLALTMVALASSVFIDRRLEATRWYQRVDEWLSARSDQGRMIIRVAVGMTMLLAWQAGSLMVPELTYDAEWVGWLQFVIVLLLFFEATVPIAGAGLIALWLIATTDYNIFYLLDYVTFLGAGFYLIVTGLDNPRIKGLGLPALYASLGFSLIWVALEKIVYPQWGMEILQSRQQLTLGLDSEFFLTAAAFVELALGYMLIIGLMSRPLALIITGVFFTTTLIFGKTEVIGHTLIHGMLIVFFLEGPGDVYMAPYTFHKRLPMRVAFVAVNFAVVLALLLVPYVAWANATYEENELVSQFEGVDYLDEEVEIDLTIIDNVDEGWVVEVTTDYIEGNIVLFLNGERLTDFEGYRIALGDLEPGTYHIQAVLVSHDDELLVYNRRAVMVEEDFVVSETVD